MPGLGDSATACSWSWINAGSSASPEYSRFRMSSIRIWGELSAKVSGIPVTGKGSLIWGQSREGLEAMEGKFRSLGRSCRLLEGSELKSVAPYLRDAPPFAAYTPSDVAIEPVDAARALLASSGASVINARALALEAKGSRVSGIVTAQGRIQADEVVVAAGLGSPELLQSVGAGLVLNSTVGVLAYSSPMPEILDHLIICPKFHVRQDWNGRLVAGGRFEGLRSEIPARIAARQQLGYAKSILACKVETDLDYFTIGRRVIPADGLPKIGRIGGFEGLYLAVMHSGMTNAAAAGKLGAREILTGSRDDALIPFSPQQSN